jgi:Family of unknown function (DUF5683)
MRQLLLFMLILLFQQTAWSQDSSYIKRTDTLLHHIPRRATRRSAMIPGWGQAYNKQYWKIPLVYGVLAIPASTYIYNNDWYQKTKFAYEARFKENNGDASDVSKIDPKLVNLSIGSIQSYRNIFRRDRDYSILYFLLAWGVNVVDATVSGHLKEFDINNNLSLRFAPYVQPSQQQSGVSLQLNFKSSHAK